MLKPLILLIVVLAVGIGIGYKIGQKSPSVGDCVNSIIGSN
ncbi:hypothetical protein pEaSNUABM50_00522 [Erwinia phage pEa_SNUABM_50]|uniref:Uncharacterized protein n=4 Tax=Eneladusvirus BF TaxID=2560751 RepID=A0A7L8ZP47_9CAUD|nr:hypothetical protein FDH34_gp422 [Serratia phage BF]QOI71451.1 hypothetical protein pEaSNUABM12_00534 [Erwinia phage pEa_SNUABM_12]QOI71972.1 hypothetical protein pEaSNUABM47_00523 [Erwinia phage pEa_SNUABM_47]QOI72512.1 hypothetical protein pEaSNUABM50_00522 [Erwinia phage pEa_SNUABM_50]QXO11643.1 hypothetical protein pEaSNUABM19_00532 [Erwinia phage pEa_SNUABM_19]QXO12191.1 hypothetical protein pEaSNUABM44_00530 [Erwinia phage pEa_SNUABM_44]QXO12747.1 hypothetical protein pEaSNUABM49_005